MITQLETPGASFQEVASTVGKMWRNCEIKDRAPYQKLADADKRRYQLEKVRLARLRSKQTLILSSFHRFNTHDSPDASLGLARIDLKST